MTTTRRTRKKSERVHDRAASWTREANRRARRQTFWISQPCMRFLHRASELKTASRSCGKAHETVYSVRRARARARAASEIVPRRNGRFGGAGSLPACSAYRAADVRDSIESRSPPSDDVAAARQTCRARANAGREGPADQTKTGNRIVGPVPREFLINQSDPGSFRIVSLFTRTRDGRGGVTVNYYAIVQRLRAVQRRLCPRHRVANTWSLHGRIKRSLNLRRHHNGGALFTARKARAR